MKRNILITFLIIIFNLLPVFAKIDVVYPSAKNVTINSKETYFSGNVDENSTLTINSVPVKLWDNRFFIHMVPLEYGNNIIKLEQNLNGQKEIITYNITRPKPVVKSNSTSTPIKYEKNTDGILYSKTIKDKATVREKPSAGGKRVVDLPVNTVLYLDGKLGNYYKIAETGGSEFWIHSSNVEEPVNVNKRIYAKVKKHKIFEDNLYTYHKFYTSHPVLYTFKQNDKNLKLSLYGADEKNAGDKNFYYDFEFSSPILGYEGYYDENSFIVKIAKNPKVDDLNMPLKGINIFIDAGHGGSEKGTVSPERIYEKDINLDIANNLIKLLQADGANVSYSRTDDIQVKLYDRVDNAKKNNALISVSIHCNSLPYGKNPYIEHGTEVHYYNENAKMLSTIIKNNLVNDLSLKDNGVKLSSFALNRSSNPVSVLVEVAYFLNPEEYMLLKNEIFRKNVAKSIEKSIKQYISCIKN